jgi:hypothetical protein
MPSGKPSNRRRSSSSSGGERATARITRALRELERAIEDNAARTIGDADLSFHHALVACSGSARLTDLMKVSMVHTRLLSLSDRRGYEVRCDVLDSHRELAEAVTAGRESQSLGVLARIMAEAASRLHGPDAGVDAQVVKALDDGAAADDQWSRLRGESAVSTVGRPRPGIGTAGDRQPIR